MKYIEYSSNNICKSMLIELALHMQEYAQSCGINEGTPLSREVVAIGLGGVWGVTTIGTTIAALVKDGVLIPTKSVSTKKGDATKWYKVIAPCSNKHHDTCINIEKLVSKWDNMPSSFLEGLCDCIRDFIDGNSNEVVATSTSLADKFREGIASFSEEEKIELLKMLGKAETHHELRNTQPILYQVFSNLSQPQPQPMTQSNFALIFEPSTVEYSEAKRLFFLSKAIKEEEYDYDDLISRFKSVFVINKYHTMVNVLTHLCNWERKGNNIKKHNRVGGTKTVNGIAY